MIVLTYVKGFTFPFPLLNPVQQPHPHYIESQQVSTQWMVKMATEEAVKAHTQSTGFRFSAEGHVLETGSQVLGDSGSSGIQNDHWRAPNRRDRMLLSLLRKACAFTGGRAGRFRSVRMPLTCKRWGTIAPDRADVVSHPGSCGTKCARVLSAYLEVFS